MYHKQCVSNIERECSLNNFYQEALKKYAKHFDKQRGPSLDKDQHSVCYG